MKDNDILELNYKIKFLKELLEYLYETANSKNITIYDLLEYISNQNKIIKEKIEIIKGESNK